MAWLYLYTCNSSKIYNGTWIIFYPYIIDVLYRPEKISIVFRSSEGWAVSKSSTLNSMLLQRVALPDTISGMI